MLAGDIAIRLKALTREFISKMKQAEGEVLHFKKTATDTSEATSRGMAKMKKSTILAMAGVSASLGFTLVKMMGVASEFEQKMANVVSVTGATGVEFDKLRAKAIEMGSKTSFSAREVADAMYYLGSAGYNADQVAKSLDGTLTLAEATQHDLADTTQTVVATLNQFQMGSEEASRVANVFAGIIKNSQATMTKLGISMSYVGAIAHSVGMSLEQTTAILGALYNAGLDASQAGTGLRMMLQRLIKPTTEAEESLAKYGLTAKDVSPELHSIGEIIDTLRKKHISSADAVAIFGTRGLTIYRSLEAIGGEALKKLQESITNTNDALEMQRIQLDTTEGSMKLLKSAIEGMSISIGSALTPVIRILADILTGIVSAFNSLPKPVKTGVAVLLALTTAITGLIAVFGALQLLLPVLTAGFTALWTAITGPVGIVIAVISALGVGVGLLAKRFREVNTVRHAEEVNRLASEYEYLKNKVNRTAEEERRLAEVTDLLNKKYPEAIKNVREYRKAYEESVAKEYENMKKFAHIENPFAKLGKNKLIDEIRKTKAELDKLEEKYVGIVQFAETEQITFGSENIDNAVKKYRELTRKLVMLNDALNEVKKRKVETKVTVKGVSEAKATLEDYYNFVLTRDELERRRIETTAKKLLEAFGKNAEKRNKIEEARARRLAEIDKREAEERKAIEREYTDFVLSEEEKQVNEIKAKRDKLLIAYAGNKEAELEITRAYNEKIMAMETEKITSNIDMARNYISQVSELLGMYYDNQRAMIEQEKEERKQALEEEHNHQMELMNKEYEETLNNLRARSVTEKRYLVDKKKIDEKYQKEKEKRDREYQKKREKLEKEAEAKELEMKKRQFRINKRIAIAQTIMHTAEAVMKAFAELGPVLGGIMAGVITGLGATKVALIASQPEPFAVGGLVEGEYGKDKNIVAVTRGEYIVNPEATAKNLRLLEYINKTRVPVEAMLLERIRGYAGGGLVGEVGTGNIIRETSGSVINNNINIYADVVTEDSIIPLAKKIMNAQEIIKRTGEMY